MTIAAILRARPGEVVSVAADLPLAALAALLTERRIGAVPVVDGATVVGIVSERDVVHALARHGAAALEAPVASAMSAPPVTIAPDAPVIAALSLMTRRRIRHLPVLDGERMVGFVSIGDLVKARIDRIEGEAAALRSYIAG